MSYLSEKPVNPAAQIETAFSHPIPLVQPQNWLRHTCRTHISKRPRPPLTNVPPRAKYTPSEDDRAEPTSKIPTELTLTQQLLMKQYEEQIARMSTAECQKLAIEIARQMMVKDNIMRKMLKADVNFGIEPPDPEDFQTPEQLGASSETYCADQVQGMRGHMPAFCPCPFTLHRGKKKRHIAVAACASGPGLSGGPGVSRRAVLVGLASLLVAPTVVSGENGNNEKPLTGFISKSGLKYFDFERGTGPSPRWGDLVNIQYTAYTISPDAQSLIKQDSSYDYGDNGYLIHHGNGEQILGLEEAIHTMSEGGRRRCIIPRDIAYFKEGLGPVPLADRRRRAFSKALMDGDGTVVFDIELSRITQDPFDRGYYDDLVPTDEELIQAFADQAGQYADE